MTSLRHRTKLVPTSSSDNLLPLHHNDKTSNNSKSWKRTSSKRRARVIRCLLIGGAVAVIFVFGVLSFAYRVLSATDPSSEEEANPKGVIAKFRQRLQRDQEHEKHKNRRKYESGKDLLEHLKHKKDTANQHYNMTTSNKPPSTSEGEPPSKRKEPLLRDAEEVLKEQEEIIHRIEQGEKLPPKPLQQSPPHRHQEPKEHSLEYLENADLQKRDNNPLGEEVSIHEPNHPQANGTRQPTECVGLFSHGNGKERKFISLTPDMMNDNYCDCADGLDEPHTSACAHVLVNQRAFQCGADNVWIDSSRVRDGIRDCPNGADEMIS